MSEQTETWLKKVKHFKTEVELPILYVLACKKYGIPFHKPIEAMLKHMCENSNWLKDFIEYYGGVKKDE